MIEKVEIVKSVENKIKNGNFKEALGEITRCLQSYPNFIVAKVLKAECLLKLGNIEESLALANEVLFLAPDNIKARKIAIEANLQLNNLDEARSHIDFLSFLLPSGHSYLDEIKEEIRKRESFLGTSGESDSLDIESHILSQQEGSVDKEEIEKNEKADTYVNSEKQGSDMVDRQEDEEHFGEEKSGEDFTEKSSQPEGDLILDTEDHYQNEPEDKTDIETTNEKRDSEDNFLIMEEDIESSDSLLTDTLNYPHDQAKEFLSDAEKSIGGSGEKTVSNVERSIDYKHNDNLQTPSEPFKDVDETIETIDQNQIVTGVLEEQVETVRLPEKKDDPDIKTKTLALIYEKQGMLEEALEILEQLYKENGDENLLIDIERIKTKMKGEGKNQYIMEKITILQNWLERVKWHSNS